MAILKAVSSYSADVAFCVRRVSTDETPSLEYNDLAALREKSRDEPPSPPPQPPPSPSGWSRPSDPDIVSMGSVGPCKTLVSSSTNSRKDLHPHIRVTLFPWSLMLTSIPGNIFGQAGSLREQLLLHGVGSPALSLSTVC